MADLKLTDLTAITQGNVDSNVLLYCVDVTGGTVDRKVTRQNLYLAVANTFSKGQTINPDTATALSMLPPTGPTGSGSPFFAAIAINTGTTGFITTAQTGDYDTAFIGQVTLTNPSSGTITNAASLKIVGAPIAGTNVVITNNYAFWVAAGVSRFDEQIKLTSILNTPLTVTAASAPVGGASEFVGGINSLAVTTAFATTAQTGDFVSRKMGQVTLTNPSSGTITNASTLKITGAPIASTNVTITNAYALWVAAGTTLLQATTLTGTLTMSGANIVLGANSIITTPDYNIEESGGFILVQRNSGNNSSYIAVAPSGTNNIAGVFYSRTNNPSNETLLIGSDKVVSGEFVLQLTAGSGTIRPLNIYMATTKLLSFDVANTVSLYTTLARYNNIATAGLGVPAIYASKVAQSVTGAAAGAFLSYTPPAVAGTYKIRVAWDIKTVNTGTGIGFTLAYTDATGTTVSATAIALAKLGSTTLATTVAADGNYYAEVEISIDNSATPIAIALTGIGSITASNATAEILQA